MIRTDVLILGGGLAGLSTAYHLQKRNPRISCLVAERLDRAGGLAGSISKDGFIFDHTGHLLHLHNPYGKRLVQKLLKGNLSSLARSSWIYSHGTYTRYPFQANTFGLPPRVIEDCVAGFAQTIFRPKSLPKNPNFEEWCLSTFGDGISRHFMLPYNQKMWRRPLSTLTTSWQGRFIPKPKPEEVVYGALADQKENFGYNAEFLYPVRGGIQALPDALARGLTNVSLGCRVTAIDLSQKVARIEPLGEVGFERLVNTAPLADFLDMSFPLPDDVARARKSLRWNSVYNLNLGVARERISDKHWIYFPERGYPFYRVGFPGNFSGKLGPRGSSSLYIEAARRPEEKVNLKRLENQMLEGLVRSGILRRSDRILTKLWVEIPCAYVVYDFSREKALASIFRFLEDRGVDSIGRFGGWKYSFMEEAILDGKGCAEKLAAL